MGYITDLVPRELPQTGQTTVYRAGDDADNNFGWPGQGAAGAGRFRDNGDGTITDFATGLMWVKDVPLILPGATGVHPSNQIQIARGDWANNTLYSAADLAKDTAGSTYWVCVVEHTSDSAPTTFAQDRAAHPTYWRATVWAGSAANLTTWGLMDWNDAIANCLNLDYAGFDDWRLPNFLEAYSLIEFERFADCIYTIFTNRPSAARLWTSTTVSFGTANAWYLDTMLLVGTARQKTLTDYPMWPCRGGVFV